MLNYLKASRPTRRSKIKSFNCKYNIVNESKRQSRSKSKKKRRHSSSSGSSDSEDDSSSSSSDVSTDLSPQRTNKRKKSNSKSRKKKSKSSKSKKRMKRSSSSSSDSSTVKKKKTKKKKKKKSKQKGEKKILCTEPLPIIDVEKQQKIVEDVPTGRKVGPRPRVLKPMTREEWEKQQSVIRRVVDEETGRERLIKGDGEILEEIVSRNKHMEINKMATKSDGEFFSKQMGLY